MKVISRQSAGLLLIGIAILAAVMFQLFGPGLITVDRPPVSMEPAAPGVTLTSRTSVHFVTLPLVAFGIVGFVLALLPWRKPVDKS
jgi:hypothetical protein